MTYDLKNKVRNYKANKELKQERRGETTTDVRVHTQLFFFFFFFFLVFLSFCPFRAAPTAYHMEVPRIGVESEL